MLLGPTPIGHNIGYSINGSNQEHMLFSTDDTVSSTQSLASPVHLTHAVTPTLAPVQVPSHCPHGCRGTFSQPGEYRRHMKKHAEHRYPCTQLSCTISFYRQDKLRDHLRQKHKLETQPRRRQPQRADTTGSSSTVTLFYPFFLGLVCQSSMLEEQKQQQKFIMTCSPNGHITCQSTTARQLSKKGLHSSIKVSWRIGQAGAGLSVVP